MLVMAARLSHPVLMFVTKQGQVSRDRRAQHVPAGEALGGYFQ
jgi:hypothetical protein